MSLVTSPTNRPGGNAPPRHTPVSPRELPGFSPWGEELAPHPSRLERLEARVRELEARERALEAENAQLRIQLSAHQHHE
jgi:hypothetical protein